MLSQVLQKLLNREDLTFAESEAIFSDMLHGLLTPAQIAAVLMGLSAKEESADEIAGAVTILKGKAERIHVNVSPLIDICGTGGDSLRTFNISTTVAFVLAGAGVTVAKHGNRNISSYSGSADVFEILGILVQTNTDRIQKAIERIGIGFLYAPKFHPCLKFVMPVRQELKIRTIFNIVGPLVNPLHPEVQLIGVYSKELCGKLVHTLQKVGVTSALVVHGEDGMDEVTLTGKTYFSRLEKKRITTGEIDPEKFGFSLCEPVDLIGGTPKKNAKILLSILQGKEKGPKLDIVLLNAAVAFWILKKAKNIQEGVALARKSIESGTAFSKLQELQKFFHA